MKAITQYQPWASLIADGDKTVETRSWAPPLALVGQRIAIHAAKRKVDESEWSHELRRVIDVLYPSLAIFPWPCGVVVATAELYSVSQVDRHESNPNGSRVAYSRGVYPEQGMAVLIDPFGDYSVGRYLWHLRDIRKLPEPVPATGRQGIWNWEPPE